ncbi:TPA: hypothetical protein N0F65_003686 [Lagenidium giganteum]|uniref:HECT-type E3 ubiquitin transferase n=1 Tax=Lagenidium giganteum TaxID=4803 RepID=A0AAV2YRP5_9STRA|nr:TPA: hypothetical protein N0F65_003686 [Lagenidium giganteum]
MSLLGQLQAAGDSPMGFFPFAQMMEGAGGSRRFQQMLQSIGTDSPSQTQLAGLSELCETLSMSTEESLVVSGFSVDKFVAAVVALIRFPSTMEVLILSTRALSSLLDLFPRIATPKAMSENVVPSLCAKLMEIEYMDVAELAFQIFERIICRSTDAATTATGGPVNSSLSSIASQAADYRRLVIKENGFVVLLQFVDFFPVEIQRVAARVVSRLCTNFPVDLLPELEQGMPFISNLLNSYDAEILQSGCESFRRLGESKAFSGNAMLAATVSSDSVCQRFLELLSSFAGTADGESDSTKSSLMQSSSNTSVIRFMSCVLSSSQSGSSATVDKLRFVQLPPIVASILDSEDVLNDMVLLRVTLKLVIAILPIADEIQASEYLSNGLHDVSATEFPLAEFAHQILPSIVRVYDATSRNDLRYDCLGVIYRCCTIIYTKNHPLSAKELVEVSRLASFLARVLRPNSLSCGPSEKDLLQVHLALEIVQRSVDQCAPAVKVCKQLFERHGVASAVRFYAKTPEGSAIAEKDAFEIVVGSKRLVDNCFGEESGGNSLIARLRAIVEKLRSSCGLVQLENSFRKLLELAPTSSTCDEDWFTAHEIACSGLVVALMGILTTAEGKKAFASVFFSPVRDEAAQVYIEMLIQKIQDAISAEKDAFLLDSVSSDGKQGQQLASGGVASDLDQLTQHIKVRVLIEKDNLVEAKNSKKDKLAAVDIAAYNKNRKHIQDTIVLVEPLARVETIEEFISEKLFGAKSAGSLLDELSNDDGEDHDDVEDDLTLDGGKERKVHAYYKGNLLPTDMSILEVLVKYGNPEEDPTKKEVRESPSLLGKLWSNSVHDITFRVVDPSKSKASKRPSTQDAMSSECTRSSKEDDTMAKGIWWDNVWELLALLRIIHEMRSELNEQHSSSMVNTFVCQQVNRALQQPVRVVTNSLPQWCSRVVNDFPFMLDYETRYHFIYATTCGSSRAIQYLCKSVWKKALDEEASSNSSRNNLTLTPPTSRRRLRDRGGNASGTAALTNISRMVKLPRLKVRVTRSRLLQSAMKLLNMYGGKKAVIEIEFLGEVGTGLGPTTEFFTLICQEIQARKLRMWRDEGYSADEGEKCAMIAKDGSVDKKETSRPSEQPSLPVRGYHRVAVYFCTRCTRIRVPHCTVHKQLLTKERKLADTKSDEGADTKPSSTTVRPAPMCSVCLDTHDWHSAAATCDCPCSGNGDGNHETGLELKWWILSAEEIDYLTRVFPKESKSVKHPVLQCAHCDTVNFPGTDAGIVTLDGERMISRTGRRMFERDYRAVMKHVSPLCEGTPLKQINSVLTREDVDILSQFVIQSPEVLESEIDALGYLSDNGFSDPKGLEPVDAPFGLFPRAYSPAVIAEIRAKREAVVSSHKGDMVAGTDVLSYFNFLGRFVAQAFLDERLLNLPLSRPFLRMLRKEKLVGENVPVEQTLAYLKEMDPSISSSLGYLYGLAVKAKSLTEDSAVYQELKAEVEGMCLSFTLVGDHECVIAFDGANTPVTIDCLESYVEANLSFLFDKGIAAQVEAFHDGFEKICNEHDILKSFSILELEHMLMDKAQETLWDREGRELREHMVCDHGFTPESKAIYDLIAILCAMSLDEQRLFVRFVTGSNRLPLGGLARLEPKLTVVRKLAASGADEDTNASKHMDDMLPSASTCTNYLKLPDYSSRELMKEKLLYCIHEGQHSFHLS